MERGDPGLHAEPLTLGEMVRGPAAQERLEAGGLTAPAARDGALLLARCAAMLLSGGAETDAAARAFFVPGRVEILGKHTDYCGGRSLLAAAERGFLFASLPSGGPSVTITDARSGETDSFALGPDLPAEPGRWPVYPRTAARRLARNFPGALRGARIAFASNLPPAAGLSSSSAFLVGAHLALAAESGIDARQEYRREIDGPEALAGYLASMENGSSFGSLAGDRGVGTQGGSEDHTAILCSRSGTAALYSFSPVRLERRIPLGDAVVFTIAASGIAAEKTGTAMVRYNRASRLARAAMEAWNGATDSRDPHLGAILASGPGAAERLREILSRERHGEFSTGELLDRAEHVAQESGTIVPEAAACLERGDLDGFGRWAARSQDLGERLLRNQVPETVFLAREALRMGASGASAFGAGFGGSVWALVPRCGAAAFLEQWQARYAEAFPARAAGAAFFITGPSAPAFGLGR